MQVVLKMTLTRHKEETLIYKNKQMQNVSGLFFFVSFTEFFF